MLQTALTTVITVCVCTAFSINRSFSTLTGDYTESQKTPNKIEQTQTCIWVDNPKRKQPLVTPAALHWD